MKDRRKRDVVSWNRFFWCTLFLVFSCVLFSGFTFSTFRFFFFGEKFHPEIVSTWRTPAMEALSGDSSAVLAPSIRETVMLPDQVLVFLKYPPSSRLFTKEDLLCVYISANKSSSQSQRWLPPIHIDGKDADDQIVRCPLIPRGYTVSLSLKSGGYIHPGPTHKWESLVYEALIDRDNTTVVFVKGLNLRPEKLSNASRFECVYGWDFRRPKFLLRSQVISMAQEIVRCKTPLSVLGAPQMVNSSIKVSIRVKGRGTLHSIARPGLRSMPQRGPPERKPHEMCICTMLRNQARFLREWVMYHAQVGVQSWYIYDNNSDDDIEDVMESLVQAGFNISRHVWPWIKTQEAGFAHCALRARESCEWVGFIDVDEFFYSPLGLSLHDVISNQSESGNNVAEIRTSCYSFGPSGLKHVPPQGVMVGYTCRLGAPERHKSIVKPEALNSTLINVVHHFHLSEGFRYVNADRGVLVINHYKYQAWEVFKEKFYRRVATYVADWQNEQNVGSKDRAPGLGTRAVEPPDWSSRFCEVTDTGLRNLVLQKFMDPLTNNLPWEEMGRGYGNQASISHPSLSRKESHFSLDSNKKTKKDSKMVSEEQKESPRVRMQSNPVDNSQNMENLFSPRFKSVAAMAGWDEESILFASLIVEDTPERQFKHKKRSDLHFKTPPSTNTRRKRRDQKKSPISIPVPILNLEEEEELVMKESEKKKTEPRIAVDEESKLGGDKLAKDNPDASCSNSALPCMDKLREELSCAICLEICFEPSTTSCGHSFCKKCLRSAADKCGKKCPKCRQLIGNSRSCTVNTVLWNTIQLLFPQEVEAKMASGRKNQKEHRSSERKTNNDLGSRNVRPSRASYRDTTSVQPSRVPNRGAIINRGMLRQDDPSTRVSNRDASTSRDMWNQDEEDTPLVQRLRRREALERLILSREATGRRRRGIPSQDEDTALALRLQREEFMEAFGGTQEQSGISLSSARANLRVMASRAAISIHSRGRPI
ncbi:PREDICTED: UPF0392 protein RCOM_0530710 [Populus euphratica]|uniref:UPF0392 protein RCOM_0530710 n=1 Tax=Populus euphratica TaxID=75702 RepID=A0AAJ6VCV5_POPEU|nr:PREDICTED: UPF0392 protein RCOM_0530710 [Populus euphratica]